MSIHASIKNDEPEGSKAVLEVMVVTVGDIAESEVKHALAAQQSLTVEVHTGQFLMVDEKEGG